MLTDFNEDIEFEQGIVYTTGRRFAGGRAIDPDAWSCPESPSLLLASGPESFGFAMRTQTVGTP